MPDPTQPPRLTVEDITRHQSDLVRWTDTSLASDGTIGQRSGALDAMVLRFCETFG